MNPTSNVAPRSGNVVGKTTQVSSRCTLPGTIAAKKRSSSPLKEIIRSYCRANVSSAVRKSASHDLRVTQASRRYRSPNLYTDSRFVNESFESSAQRCPGRRNFTMPAREQRPTRTNAPGWLEKKLSCSAVNGNGKPPTIDSISAERRLNQRQTKVVQRVQILVRHLDKRIELVRGTHCHPVSANCFGESGLTRDSKKRGCSRYLSPRYSLTLC